MRKSISDGVKFDSDRAAQVRERVAADLMKRSIPRPQIVAVLASTFGISERTAQRVILSAIRKSEKSQ